MSTSMLFTHPVTPTVPRLARLAPQRAAQPVEAPPKDTP